jgi:hypothetical protein
MGLRTNDGTRRKAFGAYRTMTRQIGHYTLERQLVGQDKPTSGVQAHLFRSDKDTKFVIWNIDSEASVILDNVANARIEEQGWTRKTLCNSCPHLCIWGAGRCYFETISTAVA